MCRPAQQSRSTDQNVGAVSQALSLRRNGHGDQLWQHEATWGLTGMSGSIRVRVSRAKSHLSRLLEEVQRGFEPSLNDDGIRCARRAEIPLAPPAEGK